ncbi:MAG TPA: hypothetical protein VIE65_12760 [Methylobacter sp.]|jgi:hypothetical protein
MTEQIQTVKTTDGHKFKSDEAKLVGSVPKVRSRDVSQPARVGEFPVFVEQSGSYRMFTYNKKIVSIDSEPKAIKTTHTTWGRKFDTLAFKTDDEANQFMLQNKEYGLIDIDSTGLRHLALLTDKGQSTFL